MCFILYVSRKKNENDSSQERDKTTMFQKHEWTMIPRRKWNILQYIGCPLPVLTAFQKTIIRQQLDQRYCPECGEYIYNPYRKRKIVHHHSRRRKFNYEPLMKQRILIHSKIQIVEWRRRFPRVMRLITSERDMMFYNNMKPHFIRRIPALRVWSVDEWNIDYPEFFIYKEDRFITLMCSPPKDVLQTPHLLLC